jgi:hypothetical protein
MEEVSSFKFQVSSAEWMLSDAMMDETPGPKIEPL